MSTSGLAVVALLIVLATEYGFQSRKAYWHRMRGRWPMRGSALRLVAWAVLWLAADGLARPRTALLAAGLFAWGEFMALAVRALLNRTTDRKRAWWVHLLPFPLALAAPLAAHLLPGLRFSPPGMKLAGILLGIALMWTWGTVFTVSIVEISRPGQIERAVSPTVGAGEVIGILERLITLLLVTSGGLVAVGFVVAAKAAVRFPLFKERAFAEYFLIGTLSSVGLATVVGLALRMALV